MKSAIINEIELKTDELEYELTRNGKELSIGAENVLNDIREMLDAVEEEFQDKIDELQDQIDNPNIKQMVYCMVNGEAQFQEKLPELIEALKENGII